MRGVGGECGDTVGRMTVELIAATMAWLKNECERLHDENVALRLENSKLAQRLEVAERK